MMAKHKIAVIPGDGIGNEVVPEGIKVLEAVARKFDIAFEWDNFDWSCEVFKKTGKMMPDDGIDQLSRSRLDLPRRRRLARRARPRLAVGPADPDPPQFDQYVNLRPCKLMPGRSPAREPQARRHRLLRRAREHRGRVFSRSAAACSRAPTARFVVQQTVFTRKGCDRVLRYAFELATRAKKHVTSSATKSNGIIDHDAVLGRALRRDGEALSRRSRPTSSTSTS
jgi:tartrate dehydrogenase/decarboxylase/D-malate dehydrogenase